jgi:YVTN family beta-propeller protein
MSYIGSNINNKDYYNSTNRSIKENPEPFIGPRPFYRTIEDQNKFFGRDEEADEIVSIISTHKLVLIYAQSGAGKTSLFNAQVIPILERDGFEVLPVTRIKSSNIISSYSSSETLDTAGIKNLYMFNALQNIKEDLTIDLLKDKSLSKFLEEYFPIKKDKNNNNIPQMVIFDQFEEIFDFFPSNWKEQRKDFFNQVANALKQIKSLQIVFIIREDYLAQLDPYRNILPERLSPRFRLERLREDSALVAVKGPLENIPKHYLKFDMKVIDDDILNIINELMKIQVEYFPGETYQVEGEFIEPIQLQVVFKTWWEKMIKFDTKNSNQNIIDVSDVDNALENFYEEALKEVIKRTNINEDEIRKWCEQNLITSSGTRSIVHRSIQSTAGIKNEVIDILEEKYLVKENWRAGSRWYELAHDRLVKPITLSNRKWEHEQNIKKKSKIKKITIPIVVLSIIVIVSLSLWHNEQYFIPPIESISAGDLPFIVAVNPNSGLVYVTNPKSDSISILAGKRNDIIGSISVPNEPTDISVDSKNNLIYVSHPYNDLISVIEGSSGKIINLIKFENPLSIALNSDGSKMYVTSEASKSVSTINTHTNKILNNITVGNVPTGVSVDSKNNLIYLANLKDNTVTVIDEKNYSKLKDIQVGEEPISIAINYVTNKVYVANLKDNTVTVIDEKNYSKLKDIQVGEEPISIAIDYDTNKVYVVNSGNKTISVIDGELDTVVAILDVGNKPSSIDINPHQNILYVSNTLDHEITAIDIDYKLPHNVLSKIPVGIHPAGIAIDNINQVIYVANTDSNNVSVIDARTNMAIKLYKVEKKPKDLIINTKSHKLYVSNSMSDTVSVINLYTNKPDPPIHTQGKYPTGLAVNERTNLVYVANSHSNSVSVINGTTNNVTSTIKVGKEPTDITVDSENNLVYVANHQNESVSVINGTTNNVTSTIKVGKEPTDITVDSENNLVYVANYKDDTLSIIDGNTQKLINGTIPIGRNNFGDGPISITVDSKNNLVYVINFFSDTISIIDNKLIKDSIQSDKIINNKTKYIITTIPHAGNSPTDITFNALTNQIYVTNGSNNMTNVFNPPISR